MGRIVTLLPTPKTLDSYKQRKLNEKGENRSHTTGKKFGLHLTQLAEARMLPTPCARDFNGARSKEALEKAGRTKTNSLPDLFAQSGKISQLNPHYVCEMMGFPKDWTLLPFEKANGEKKA